MDLALVLFFVLIGTGAILYAGLRPPARKDHPQAEPNDGAALEGDEDKPAPGTPDSADP